MHRRVIHPLPAIPPPPTDLHIPSLSTASPPPSSADPSRHRPPPSMLSRGRPSAAAASATAAFAIVASAAAATVGGIAIAEPLVRTDDAAGLRPEDRQQQFHHQFSEEEENEKMMNGPEGGVDDAYEGSEVVSSRFSHTPQYTKLDVMSSGSVRNVLNFFHVVVLTAYALAIGQLIYMLRGQPSAFQAVLLPIPGILSEAGFRKGIGYEVDHRLKFRNTVVDHFPAGPRLDAAEQNLAKPMLFLLLVQGDAGTETRLAEAGLFKCAEAYVCDICTGKLAGVVESMGARALNPVGFAHLRVSKAPPSYVARCGARVSVRQAEFDPEGKDLPAPAPDVAQKAGGIADGLTSGAVEAQHERSGATDASAAAAAVSARGAGVEDANHLLAEEDLGGSSNPVANQGTVWKKDDMPQLPPRGSSAEVVRKYKVELADWLIANGHGPEDSHPASFIRTKVRYKALYANFVLAIYVTLCIMSLFTFAMALVFVVRLVRLGRAKITHEQIWVVLLLFMAALYWNFIDSLYQVDRHFVRQAEISSLQLPGHGKASAYESFLPGWYPKMTDVIAELCRPAWTGIIFFYTWVNLHTYRILDPGQRLTVWPFYFPKLILLVPYILYKALARTAINISLSEIPFLSLLVWVRHYHHHGLRVWATLRSQFLYSVGAAAMELILVSIIIWEAVKTNRVLRRAKYMKYRTKQIGFRFFVYLNAVFYSSYVLMHFILIMALPSHNFLLPVTFASFNLTVPGFWRIAPSFLLLGYAVVEAYVKLPKEALGLVRGWFFNSELGPSYSSWSRSARDSAPKTRQSAFDGSDEFAVQSLGGSRTHSGNYSSSNPNSDIHTFRAEARFDIDFSSTALGADGPMSQSTDSNGPYSLGGSIGPPSVKMPKFLVDHDSELNFEIVEPVRYRERESGKRFELRANSFTMETHVMMFNFAWYVYYHGTDKAKNVHPADADRFKVFAHVANKETDTHALVIDSDDRIIVAFRGTTSKRNLQTSIQIYHENLSAVVPTAIDDRDETDRLKALFGRSYSNAKVHKGFAIAYRSVANDVLIAIRTLLKQRKRPVFLCGHSLGASLATLCSLDAWIKLDLNRREIFVSTFGSPRVGNELFTEVYKSCVPLHWRIVVIPDMITKLPKVGYKHVGTKVTLTPYGRMLIDPNMLEQLHWSNNSSGFAYHRKASYLLAMRNWCIRNHGSSFVPNFWPFPVSVDDEKRFHSDLVASSVSSKDTRRAVVPDRIIEMDAMVDALGSRDHYWPDEDEEELDMDVVHLWGRLARRALLQDALVR